ncbi:hypothetical protein Pelo_12445 [Pelomyxa schiedti]|nr:hypothetical protein Pelo_12445 [Pelomyxa schiedti]
MGGARRRTHVLRLLERVASSSCAMSAPRVCGAVLLCSVACATWRCCTSAPTIPPQQPQQPANRNQQQQQADDEVRLLAMVLRASGCKYKRPAVALPPRAALVGATHNSCGQAVAEQFSAASPPCSALGSSPPTGPCASSKTASTSTTTSPPASQQQQQQAASKCGWSSVLEDGIQMMTAVMGASRADLLRAVAREQEEVVAASVGSTLDELCQQQNEHGPGPAHGAAYGSEMCALLHELDGVLGEQEWVVPILSILSAVAVLCNGDSRSRKLLQESLLLLSETWYCSWSEDFTNPKPNVISCALAMSPKLYLEATNILRNALETSAGDVGVVWFIDQLQRKISEKTSRCLTLLPTSTFHQLSVHPLVAVLCEMRCVEISRMVYPDTISFLDKILYLLTECEDRSICYGIPHVVFVPFYKQYLL